MSRDNITEPIEGFFIESKDGMIFDVKGLSQPSDRIIAFVRYIPWKFYKDEEKRRKDFVKLYDLKERYSFLAEKFPEYLFEDPKGRGLLQGVKRDNIHKIYDPRKKLSNLMKKVFPANSLESLTSRLVNSIVSLSGIKMESIGISGSLLVDLNTENSDIDLIIYGEENGLAVYSAMPEIFDKGELISRYSDEDLKSLWKERGQENQIDFKSFLAIEAEKNLQGKISDVDFYIRCVPYPDEIDESYNKTMILSLGELELKAKIDDDTKKIFTPCIYTIKEVELISTRDPTIIPSRIYSVRGRYCDLVKSGDKVHVKGRIEQVIIENQLIFYQLILGSSSDEFFVKE